MARWLYYQGDRNGKVAVLSMCRKAWFNKNSEFVAKSKLAMFVKCRLILLLLKDQGVCRPLRNKTEN